MTAQKLLNDALVIMVVTLATSLAAGFTVAQVLDLMRRGTR